MKFLISLITLLTVSASAPEYPQRVDDEALDRMHDVFPYVRQVELNTDVPPKVVLGTTYNESSAIPHVKGDGGISYGLGQIRCFWLRELDTPTVNHCHELLVGWKNVYVIGEIFQHLHDKYPDKTWREKVKLYHLGSQALYTYIDDSSYISRSFNFGGIFLPHYNAANVVRDDFSEFKITLNELNEVVSHGG